MFRRKASPDAILERARRRVTKITTPDLLLWADQALFGLGRDLDTFRRSGDLASLTEALEASVALRAVLEEVTRRTDTRHTT